MKKKCVVLVSLFSLASLWMRPIMMRYRANNIMFNKQTTALASAAKNPRSYLVRFNSFVGRVKILFLIITFSFSLSLSLLLLLLFSRLRSINFYIGPFLLLQEYKNTPYTWWFYVDQPNRTNINFENMIIIHGYCIQMNRFFWFPCLSHLFFSIFFNTKAFNSCLQQRNSIEWIFMWTVFWIKMLDSFFAF